MEVKIKRYKSGKNKGSVRKIDVKLDKYDSWCVPWTISHIMAPLLKQLKDTRISFGAINKEDVPDKLHSTYDENGFSVEAYDWVLDELIWMFEVTSTEFEDEPNFITGREWDAESDLNEHFNKLTIDEDKKLEYDAYHQRVDNAWRLFGAYARTLWD